MYLLGSVVQGIALDTQLLLEPPSRSINGDMVLLLAREAELVDRVSEIVAVAVVFEVRNEFVDGLRAGAEGATRREVDVTDDLVYTDETSDVAALVSLFLELLGPAFLNTLVRNVR